MTMTGYVRWYVANLLFAVYNGFKGVQLYKDEVDHSNE